MIKENDFQSRKEHLDFRFGISREDFISMNEYKCDRCGKSFMVGKLDVEPIGEEINKIYKRVDTARCPYCDELVEIF